MSVINRIILKTDTNGIISTGQSSPIDSPHMLRRCADLFGRAAQGACAANLQIANAPVAAQATVTFSGNGTNADTLTVAGVVITIKTSGAAGGSNQVNVGVAGTGADIAGWVAALINGQTSAGFTGSSTSWAGICTASAAAGVITLTAAIPGTIGNGLALAKSSSAIALTNLWGASVAGSEGTVATFAAGL